MVVAQRKMDDTMMSFRELANTLARMDNPPVEVCHTTLRTWALKGKVFSVPGKKKGHRRKLKVILMDGLYKCKVSWVRAFLNTD